MMKLPFRNPTGAQTVESPPKASDQVSVEHLPNDVVMIEGVKYAGGLFRQLGVCQEGKWFRIVKRSDDGVLTINTVNDELQAQFTEAAGPAP